MMYDPSSTNPVSLLQQLVAMFKTVADRLAPNAQQSTPVRFDGVNSVKGWVQTVPLTKPYNQFVVCLSAGTVNMYRNTWGGSGSNQIPDMVFNAVDNPLPIPMGLLNDTQLIFVVDTSTVVPAKGFIYINRY